MQRDRCSKYYYTVMLYLCPGGGSRLQQSSTGTSSQQQTVNTVFYIEAACDVQNLTVYDGQYIQVTVVHGMVPGAVWAEHGDLQAAYVRAGVCAARYTVVRIANHTLCKPRRVRQGSTAIILQYTVVVVVVAGRRRCNGHWR